MAAWDHGLPIPHAMHLSHAPYPTPYNAQEDLAHGGVGATGSPQGWG